jgi:hypothetical protein
MSRRIATRQSCPSGALTSPYSWSSPTVTQEDGNGGNTVAGNGNVLKRWGVADNLLSFDNLAIGNGNAVGEFSFDLPSSSSRRLD